MDPGIFPLHSSESVSSPGLSALQQQLVESYVPALLMTSLPEAQPPLQTPGQRVAGNKMEIL